ncbi:replication initiation factor domain-containing protein [Mammaliicoccus vitulinus]|uniref:replication initiation factor domain-containing protein n=1 Tax=Mammaliicoccus vitulinus TaxID=71237 RepID=UPI00248C4325|nr:replication initiation factor domain-containing protein [Mammaliicoccus vitulinus]
MLDVQTDEFTLVLQTKKKPNSIEGWEVMALDIIEEFVNLSNVELVLGNLKDATYGLPQSYSHGLMCDDVPFYFAIAYHESFIQMGVCIKFSAHSWMKYRSEFKSIFGYSIQIHEFLKNINSTDLYSSRISRIDVAIDFLNENVNVNTIYKQLSRGNQIVRNVSGRKNNSGLSAITKNNVTSTFYLGSRGKNIKAFLRVYDKKNEQLETFGTRYAEALKYDNWVRFEAVFKGTYAHDLSTALESIQNDQELLNLLVSALTDRYQFYYTKSNNLTKYSKKMLDLLNQKDFKFKSPSPRLNLLEQSQKHIISTSGLFTYLYKVKELWGYPGLIQCLHFLHDEFLNYEPTDDVLAWIKKYSVIYHKQGPPFK